MKKIFATLSLIAMLAIASLGLFAQSTPPPPPVNPGGGNHPPVGGDSPIGSGLLLLLGLGAAYGSKKVYDARKKLSE